MPFPQRLLEVFAREQTVAGRFALDNRALKRIVLVCAGVIGIYSLTMCLSLPTASGRYNTALSGVMIVAGCLASYALLARSQRVWAGLVFMFSSYLTVIWGVWHAGGLQSPGMANFLLLVAMSGSLLGAPYALLAAVLSVLAAVFLLWAGHHGVLPAPTTTHTASTRLQAVVMQLVLISLTQVAVAVYIRRAQREAEKSDALKAEAERRNREAEAIYRQMYETMMEAYVRLDLRGVIVEFNETFREISGFSREHLLGMEYRALVPHYSTEEWQSIIAHTLVPQGHSDVVEISLRHASGRDVAIEHRLSLLRNAEGTPIGAWAFLRDVTERKERERQWVISQRMEAIGSLAGGIAHDFNNVLTGIIGNLGLAALDLKDNPAARANLDEAVRASQRAKELIGRILLFTRGGVRPKEPTRLEAVIKEAVGLLRASLPASISFHLSLDPQCPPVVCNPTEIHQVMMNLCTNAEYAMRERGGTIQVSLHSLKATPLELSSHPFLSKGPVVSLEVADTGTGMAPEVLRRIFDPFFTTKPMGEGTGLGLAVVHRIVSDHGGRISATSTPGEGTRFQILLPAVAGVPFREGNPTASPFEVSAPVSALILLVDDDEIVLTMSEKVLRKLGYEVEAYADPVRALNAFRTDPDRYSLILTDATMPSLSGAELLREARSLRPTCRAILSSGYSLDAAQGLAALGQIEFIAKPFAIGELAQTLARVLGR